MSSVNDANDASTTLLHPIEAFPKNYFYIRSKKNDMVLDVEGESHQPNSRVIVWPQKFRDNSNQLWSYDDGYLVNKNSGLVLEAKGSMFQSDLHVVQSRRKFIEDAQLQRWQFCEEGFFYPLHDSNLVLDIRGDSDAKGTSVLLYRRKETDNDNQLWKIEPLNSEPLDEPLEMEGLYNVSGDPFSFSGQEDYLLTMSGHSVWSSL